jgi:hypothetical protein
MEWLEKNAGWIISFTVALVSFLVTVFRMGRKFSDIENSIKTIKKSDDEQKKFDVMGRISAMENHDKVCQDSTHKEIEATRHEIEGTRFDLNADIESIKIDFREMKVDIKRTNDTMTETRIYMERAFGDLKSMIAALPNK